MIKTGIILNNIYLFKYIKITNKIFDFIKSSFLYALANNTFFLFFPSLSRKEYFLGNTNSYSFKLLKEKEIYKEKETT